MQWPDLGEYGLELGVEDTQQGQRLALRSRNGRAIPLAVSTLGFQMIDAGRWVLGGVQLRLADLQQVFPRVRLVDVPGAPDVRDADRLRPLRDAMRRGYGREADVERYVVAEPASGARVRARAMQQLLGVETVWMRYGGQDPRLDFAGVTLRRRQDRTIYVNVDGPFAAAATLGHEAIHVMRSEQPLLYADLVAGLRPLIDQPAFGRYAARLNHGNADIHDRKLSLDELREEAVADIVGDMLLDEQVWNAIDDRPLLQRLLDFLQAFLQRLSERWRYARPELDKTLGSREMLRDVEAARAMVVKALAAWRDTGRDTPKPVGTALAIAFRTIDGAPAPDVFPESAIREENGRLQVVFRGEWGPLEADPFDASRNAMPTFTASPDVAAVYATGSDAGRTNARVRACVLDIRHPLQLGNLLEDVVDFSQLRDALTASGLVSDAEVRNAWANIDGYLRHWPKSELAKPVHDQECEAFSRISHALADISDEDYTDTYAVADDASIQALAMRAGYDGFVYQGTFTSPDLFDRPMADCIAAGYDDTCAMAVEYRPFRRDQVRHVFSEAVPTALRTTAFRKDVDVATVQGATAGDGQLTIRRELAHYISSGMGPNDAKMRVIADQRQQAVALRAELSDAYGSLRDAERSDAADALARARLHVHDLRWALREADRAAVLLSAPGEATANTFHNAPAGALGTGDVIASALWLDWNASLAEQPERVRDNLRVAGLDALSGAQRRRPEMRGMALFEALEAALGSSEGASDALVRAGICGVRYRLEGEGKRSENSPSNYVVWDPDAIAPSAMQFQRVFHGTPHRFDQFDTAHVGAGEGVQAYGWGMYFAQREDVARFYANRVSADHSLLAGVGEQLAARALAQVDYVPERAIAALVDGRDVVGGPVEIKKATAYVHTALAKIERGEGVVYQAEIPDDASLLNWDAPMREQPVGVLAKLDACDFNGDAVIAAWKQNGSWPHLHGETFYRYLAGGLTHGAAAEGRHRDASLRLQAIGIPGLRYLDAGSCDRTQGSTSNYVIWDDKVIGRNLPETAAMLFRRRDSDSPGTFYSALLRSIEGGRGAPKAADAAAWQGWLDGAQRRGEFRQSERDWLDVDHWLTTQGGTVTRAQLTDFIRANQVQVQEVLLGDDTGNVEAWWNDEGGANEETPFNDLPPPEKAAALARYRDEVGMYEEAGDSPKFAQRRLPGGSDYRELLLTLPASDIVVRSKLEKINDRILALVDEYGSREKMPADPLAEFEQLERDHNAIADAPRSDFKSSHYSDIPNILAHVRFNERAAVDGRRVLFLEEVQSDWHQQGRKLGYKSQCTSRGISDAEFEEYRQLGQLTDTTAEQDVRYAQLRALNESPASNAVPDAPLKGTDEWVTLVLKRVVRWAAEHGFDGVAWAGGEQQVHRYSIGGKVSEATVLRTGEAWTVGLLNAEGHWIREADRVESIEELTRYVGKDAANKAQALCDGEQCDFSGMTIEFGGEGMRTFYDRILPQTFNKWLRPHGAFIEDVKVDLSTDDDDRYEVVLPNGKVVATSQLMGHAACSATYFDGATVRDIDLSSAQKGFWITPALRDAALDGLPLFRRKQLDNVVYMRDENGNLLVRAREPQIRPAPGDGVAMGRCPSAVPVDEAVHLPALAARF